MNQIDYKTIKNHNKGCRIYRSKVNFEHYVFSHTYYANAFGNINKKRSNWHVWFIFQCNDPDCVFKMIVNSNYLSEIVKSLVRMGKKKL